MAFRAVENTEALIALPGFENWDLRHAPKNAVAGNPNLGQELVIEFRKLL